MKIRRRVEARVGEPVPARQFKDYVGEGARGPLGAIRSSNGSTRPVPTESHYALLVGYQPPMSGSPLMRSPASRRCVLANS
jgi:hypothetical protein